MGQFSIFCVVLIAAWFAALGSATTGVCYHQRVRYQLVTRTRSSTYHTYYGCGWWGKRCSRPHQRTISYSEPEPVYYQEWGCCPGYTSFNGACRSVVIGIERSSFTVNEDAGSVLVCASVQEDVQMEHNRELPVILRTVASGGGANSPDDYSFASSVVNFSPSNRRQCLNISINYDYLAESRESFRVTLSKGSLPSYVSFSTDYTTVYINNIYRMQIGFSPFIYNVEEDARNVSVCASVSAVSGTIRSTLVTMSTESFDGGATSPEDYTDVSEGKTFTTSSPHHCISIPIVHDYVHEVTESFRVTLSLTSSSSYVNFNPKNATVYIDNGNRVTIGFEQIHHQVLENAGNVSVCVAVLQPADRRVSLGTNHFRVGIMTNQNRDYNGARSPDDFFHRSEILTFTTSLRRQCLAIPIVHDNLFENTEFFNVSLFRDVLLPHFVKLAPDQTVIRIMHAHRFAIGFEQTDLFVNEHIGQVSVCVRILQPANPTAPIENTHYTVTVTTDFRFNQPNRADFRDFTATSVTVTLTPSLRHQCINITITQDHIYEPHETFTLLLRRVSLPSYAVLSPNIARVTIFDVLK